MRKMAINLIEIDPAWKEGEYAAEPVVGLTGAASSLFFMGSSPLQLQKKAPTREQAERYLELLGIPDCYRQMPAELSLGTQQCVSLARALSLEPKFLLLDEPFSGIDPIAVLDLQEIIFALKKSGIGVLITDHNVRETLSVTDRAYIITEGKIFAAGTPGELGRNPEVRRIYLGENFSMD